MKISYNWIKEYLNHQVSPQEVSEMLTFCGLEVEHMEEWCEVNGGLKGLVVGEVLTCEKHPDADRLSITTVDTGDGEPRQIVCGAPNVRAGQKVIVALPGTTLYPAGAESFVIKKSKIRGAASEGMICAEDEIGTGNSHEGIIVLPSHFAAGTPASEVMGIENDYVFEIGLTPNRVDASCHIGVARDLQAVFIQNGKSFDKLKLPEVKIAHVQVKGPIGVEVLNHQACPRYSGISLKNVQVQESPAWLKKRLLSVGLRPINNVVDIGNYILLETGQPLHMFDADKITGNKVVVKFLEQETEFETLDKVSRKMGTDDLMICNENEAMCIAGIFGGSSSGVTDKTNRVFIESAYFNPKTIRKSAKKLGLKTDASFRYERGTDPGMTMYALWRAVNLLQQICGAETDGDAIDIYPTEIETKLIEFNTDYCRKLCGISVSNEVIASVLSSLDMKVIDKGNNVLEVKVPSAKVDVTRPADLVEEFLRIYGYNKVADTGKISIPSKFLPVNKSVVLSEKLSDLLVGMGFMEVWNNSLFSSSLIQKWLPDLKEELISVQNPLSSELDSMRMSLLFGLLDNVRYNRNRKQVDFRLFECGKTYHKVKGNRIEKSVLSIILAGNRAKENWHELPVKEDFYSLKSVLNVLMAKTGVKGAALENFDYALGNSSARLMHKSNCILFLCELNSSLTKEYDLSFPVYYAEIDLNVLCKIAGNEKVIYQPVPKFPEVRRDLALLVNKEITYGQLQDTAFKTEKRLLKKVSLFDVYEGDKLEKGKKSYALSFVLQDNEATLNDKQIDKCMANLASAFEKEFGADLRK